MITEENTVRVLDCFVESLDLEKLGFQHMKPAKKGTPPYHPKVLLKIYIYGYFNRVRSSRKLEVECGRNIEMKWLTDNQAPSYHTISDFRSIEPHRKALRQVFRLFNQLLKKARLFGGETVAIDGTKINAQNSKKNNISEEKLNKRLEHNLDKWEEYEAELDRADELEAKGIAPDVSPDAFLEAMAELDARTDKLFELKKMLRDAQAIDPSCNQISLTDPDARAMPLNNRGIVDVCYNVQSAVDDKHCLVADFEVENVPDSALLSKTAIAVKIELGSQTLNALADKGYHDSGELHKCAENNITTYVAFPDQSFKDRPKGFTKDDFPFDPETDSYTCKNKEQLTTNGTIYEKKGRNGEVQSRFRRYSLSFSTCKDCPFADKCLSENDRETRHGRHIERNIYETARIENKTRVINNRPTYKRRQAIVEHPFGTIKRSWGFYYTLLKGKEKVRAEYSLVFLVYNLRRAINILGTEGLKKWINDAFALFWPHSSLPAEPERRGHKVRPRKPLPANLTW